METFADWIGQTVTSELRSEPNTARRKGRVFAIGSGPDEVRVALDFEGACTVLGALMHGIDEWIEDKERIRRLCRGEDEPAAATAGSGTWLGRT